MQSSTLEQVSPGTRGAGQTSTTAPFGAGSPAASKEPGATKIGIVNGSPRSNGATARLLQEVGRYLAQAHGAQIEYVDLARTDMRFCRGCISCYRTATCCLDDGLEAVVARLKQCDGVVIGSPTHGSNVSALLKNFLDRGHFLLERSLTGKCGFCVVTEEIADGASVQKALEKFFLVAGARRSGRFLLKLDFGADPLAGSATTARLHAKLDRFAREVAERKGPGLFERVMGFILVRVLWRPVMLRKPEKYAGILKAWEERRLEGHRGANLGAQVGR